MNRVLCMALAGVGSLAWVAFCGGSDTVVSGCGPAAVRDAPGFEAAGEAKEAIAGMVIDNPGLPWSFSEDRGEPPYYPAGSLIPGDLLPDTDRFRFAAAGFSTPESIEDRSSFMEPQWYYPRLPMHQRNWPETGERPPGSIPEPAALLLLGGGFLLLAAFGRKWRERKGEVFRSSILM